MRNKHNTDGRVNKHARAAEMLQHAVAKFISLESNRTTLITVTNIDLAPDGGQATIYISIFPDEKKKGVLDFLSRKRDDVRTYIKTNTKLRRIPRIRFEEDMGEKNRQRIDELLREDDK